MYLASVNQMRLDFTRYTKYEDEVGESDQAKRLLFKVRNLTLWAVYDLSSYVSNPSPAINCFSVFAILMFKPYDLRQSKANRPFSQTDFETQKPWAPYPRQRPARTMYQNLAFNTLCDLHETAWTIQHILINNEAKLTGLDFHAAVDVEARRLHQWYNQLPLQMVLFHNAAPVVLDIQ